MNRIKTTFALAILACSVGCADFGAKDQGWDLENERAEQTRCELEPQSCEEPPTDPDPGPDPTVPITPVCCDPHELVGCDGVTQRGALCPTHLSGSEVDMPRMSTPT